MLNALLDGRRVNTLSVTRGTDEYNELSQASRGDMLICPGCGDLLDFSCGIVNHPYFRHKKGLGTSCAYKSYFDKKKDLEDLKLTLAERFTSLGLDVLPEQEMTDGHWADLAIVFPSGKRVVTELISSFRSASDTDKFLTLHSEYADMGIADILILQPKADTSYSNRQKHIDAFVHFCGELDKPALWYDTEEEWLHIIMPDGIEGKIRAGELDTDEDGNITGRFRDIYDAAKQRALECEQEARQRREQEAEKADRDRLRRETERLEAEEKRAKERAKRRQALRDEHERHISSLNVIQSALEKYFDRMNDRQREAVFTVNGPVLVLAGAGSGKTTVLVNRIANMILFGNAYERDEEELTPEERGFLECYDGDHDDETVSMLRSIVARDTIAPWSILAITFTNKAAGELKSRLVTMLGDAGDRVAASTFHSACVRILRREIAALGYMSAFTIYDTDDSKRLIKACTEALGLTPKAFPPNVVLSQISNAKNDLLSADEFEKQAGNDYFTSSVARVYKEYQKRLRASNALDFDDIIMLTVELFRLFPDVLDHYQNLYRYIMVDEYQDTNYAQYVLVSMLAQKYGNLCVVGDDDQSIYSFRGATIENILDFEDQFPDCRSIRLEQNYRSTQNILDAANAVIRNNKGRKQKALWTDKDDGEPITVYYADDERAESDFVSSTIASLVKEGRQYSDFAVLYRMNAQSNNIEHSFRTKNIPYRVIGGLRFYDRREIKDILAYMSVIANPSDMVRFRRIINTPKRNIGDATLAKIEEISSVVGDDPITVMRDSDSYAPLARKAAALKAAAKMFDDLRDIAEDVTPDMLIDHIMSATGYSDMLDEEGDEGVPRFENINELKSNILAYTERMADTGDEPTLAGFLEEASLYTDADKTDEGMSAVNMMTIHGAKGLEFPVVFIIGAEENIFPSQRSKADPTQLEEERRLAYVAITRAKKLLYITHAQHRLLMGMTQYNQRSRFVREIDPDLIDEQPHHTEFTPAHTMRHPLERTSIPSRGALSAPPPITDFEPGCRVVHPKLGAGTVLSCKPMGGDSMVEIAFDTIGTKKVMAKFAKMRKE